MILGQKGFGAHMVPKLSRMAGVGLKRAYKTA